MNDKRKKFKEDIKFENLETCERIKHQFIEEAINVMDTQHHYSTSSKLSEHLDYTVAGIFLSLYNILPSGIGFRIDYRKKSSRSTQTTLGLEIIDKKINDIKKDLFGMKVIAIDIDNNIEFPETDPNSETLRNLQEKRLSNIRFISETREWLASNSIRKTEEQFYNKYIELLERLVDSTFTKCTEEVDVTYDEKLERVKYKLENKMKRDSLSLYLSNEQICKMNILLNDLTRRLDDKLEDAILDAYLPKALESNLAYNLLKVNYMWDKKTEKKNGYVASFYNLDIDNKFKIELQTQSYYRYLVQKKGVAYHNAKVGKGMKIHSFFELVDKNDTNSLDYYLQLLESVPIKEFEKAIVDGKDTKLVQDIMLAQQHIKIKDNMDFYNEASGNTFYQNMDEYLLNVAKLSSPDMYICRSSHEFTTPTVTIQKRSLAEAFSDVLRKRDGISCLAQILVDKVDMLAEKINLNSDSKYHKNITVRDIINYIGSLSKDKVITATEGIEK